MKRPTIKDVAADCGVSTATVSLVLRDSPQIGKATKQRVRESMARLGYVYNRRAADMRTDRSRTLGLVATDVRNPYFAELMMAIEEAASKVGYTLLQGFSWDEVPRQRRLLETMVEHRIDGLVLLPAHGSRPEDLLETLGAAGLPHVLITRSVRGYGSDYVGADNVRSGELVGEHLSSLGVSTVAFLGGARGSSSRNDRVKGLRSGLRRGGVTLPPELSLSAARGEVGASLLDGLLARGKCPDAIVAYNDMYAFGILNGLRSRGIIPGRDVAVGSFDDVPDAVHQQPPLTSAAGHPEVVGAEATRLLLERFEDRGRPPQTVLIEAELTTRASTTTWAGRPVAATS
ncbi:substrate-binding domain-containing protein [Micromonospora purpureochromogenes]|uniref:LacI family DNA-binding transcriptional regulator n=1 Tax=Micromonospora purpureochromogenes TaxID=47872 RepID=UPI0033DEC5D4